jgi:hypothetical protein
MHWYGLHSSSHSPFRITFSPRIDSAFEKVVLKMIKHCRENLPDLVTGQLLGLDVDRSLEVTNCFPFPSSADNEDGDEAGTQYQIEMMRCLREVNVDSNTVRRPRCSFFLISKIFSVLGFFIFFPSCPGHSFTPLVSPNIFSRLS